MSVYKIFLMLTVNYPDLGKQAYRIIYACFQEKGKKQILSCANLIKYI